MAERQASAMLGRARPPAPSDARRVLSAVEFDVVWDTLGLGPTPVVLQLTSPGRTHAERRRIVAAAWAGLRARGLAGAGGPEPGLDRLVRLLARPAARVELRAWGRATVRAIVAGRDDACVLVRRRDDAVVLEPCPWLPGAVVDLLPAVRPGPGRAARVPTGALVAAQARPSGSGLRADLIHEGASPDEAGPFAWMLHGVDGRAQLGVVTADRWGVLRRSADVLDVLDGPHGRYLAIRSADGWTTVAPTDARRLRHRVAELLDRQSRSPWRMSCRPDSVIEPDSDG